MPATPCPPPPGQCSLCTNPPAPKCWKVTPDYGPLKDRTYYFLPAAPDYIFDPSPPDAFGFNILITDPFRGCRWTNPHGWLYIGPWMEPVGYGYNAPQYCGMLIAIRDADVQWAAYAPLVATDTCPPNACDPKAYGAPYPFVEKCTNCESNCTHQPLHLPRAYCASMAQPHPVAWSVYGPPTHTPIDLNIQAQFWPCQWRYWTNDYFRPYILGATPMRGPSLIIDQPRPGTYRVSLSFSHDFDPSMYLDFPQPPPPYHYYKLFPRKPTIEDIEAADWILNPNYRDGLLPGWDAYNWQTQPIVRHYEPLPAEDLIGTPAHPPTHYGHPGQLPDQFRLTYLPTGQTYIATPTWAKVGTSPIAPAYQSPGPTLHHDAWPDNDTLPPNTGRWYILAAADRWRGGTHEYTNPTPTTATLHDDAGPTWTIEPA